MSTYPKQSTFHTINCTNNEDVNNSGIINTNGLNVTDTLYCKNLIVTDDLSVPVTNDSYATKNSRINGLKVKHNRDLGKLVYDAETKDLKFKSNDGSLSSVKEAKSDISNNTRYKETVILEGWSADNSQHISLKTTTGNGIDINEHLYYQGSGYIIGIDNKSLEIDPLDTNTAYNPVAFMSRIDYFLLTLSSFSAISVLPVNYIGNELLNNTNTNVILQIKVEENMRYLDIRVNSNKEIRWTAILNLQKLYVKGALNKDSDDSIKYSTTDNNINWEPVTTLGNSSDCIMKYLENTNVVKISPFSENVVENGSTYANSIIDNSTEIHYKTIAKTNPTQDTSRREVISSSENNVYLSELSTSTDYNVYSYFNTLLMQPSNENIKKLTSSYGHFMYLLNDRGMTQHKIANKVASESAQFGNTFTKNSTADAYNFVTSYIQEDTSNNYYYDQNGNVVPHKRLFFAYQLTEKEHLYKTLFAITYYRVFCAKKYNNRDDSYAHMNSVIQKTNIIDIFKVYNLSMYLYKNIGQFTQNVPKNIYIKDNDTTTTHYLDLGTHHFIKSYISIRNTNTNISAFFTHYASIIIPTYSQLREFFAARKAADLALPVANRSQNLLNDIKQQFINKFINQNTIVNNVNTQDIATLDSDTSSYRNSCAFQYNNENGDHFISSNEGFSQAELENDVSDNSTTYVLTEQETGISVGDFVYGDNIVYDTKVTNISGDGLTITVDKSPSATITAGTILTFANNINTVELNYCDLEITTEPEIITTTENNILDQGVEEAYNSFSISFPINVKVTVKGPTGNYQAYVLLEVNRFNFDSY